jgi:hypothetical protein
LSTQQAYRTRKGQLKLAIHLEQVVVKLMRVMAKAADHSHSRHHHASLRPSIPSLAACDSLWSRVVTDLCAEREKCFASHVRFGLASTFQYPHYKAPLCSLDMFTNAMDYKFLRSYRCLGLACRIVHLSPRRYKAATPMFTTPPQRCSCRRLEDHGYCRNLPFQNSDSNESAKYDGARSPADPKTSIEFTGAGIAAVGMFQHKSSLKHSSGFSKLSCHAGAWNVGYFDPHGVDEMWDDDLIGESALLVYGQLGLK